MMTDGQFFGYGTLAGAGLGAAGIAAARQTVRRLRARMARPAPPYDWAKDPYYRQGSNVRRITWGERSNDGWGTFG